MIRPPTDLITAQIEEWKPRGQIRAVEAPNGEDMMLAKTIVRVAIGKP
jgi:hypothetical protein